MTLKTVTVTGQIYNPDGTPAAGVEGYATLNRPETDNGIVIPTSTFIKADEAGQFSIQLWPNARGSGQSQYIVKAYTRRASVLNLVIMVPDVDVPVVITDIAIAQPYPPIDQSLQALLGAQEAAIIAKASKDAAAGAEAGALTSAEAAADSADEALEYKNTAETAKTEAQTAAGLAVDAQADIHTNWQGKLDIAAQHAETATTQAGIATDKAAEASGSAATANAAKTAAELARDAAMVGAVTYPDEATGRAAVADGGYFKVIGSGDVAAREYRRANASTSVLVAEYPAAVSVSRINSLIATSGESPKAAHIFEDGSGLVLGYIDSKGGFFTAESEHSHQQQINAARGRANLALRATLVGAPLLDDVAIADSKSPLFANVLVAPYGMGGTSIQRTPAVVATASNGLLMFWGAGDPAYNGDSTGVTMYRCNVAYNQDNGSLIAGPAVLFQAPSTPSGVVKHPMLCRLASGRIVLCYDTNDVSGEVGKYHIYCRVSDDDGVTFSDPVEIAALSESNTVLACGTSGRITVMSDGRLILPIYGMWSSTNMVSCLYSDDDGETWEMGGRATTPASSANESCAVELPNGDLLFIARWGGMGKKSIFRSVDRGETLVFDREAFDLPGYASAPSAILDQGKIICSAPTSPETGMRTKHRLKMSYDNGDSFNIGSGLFPDSYYVGYSCLCKISDGVLAMAYEASDIANINYKESCFLSIFNMAEVYNNVRTN